ncbi:MAG: hypothetical protein HYV94_22640, partial [Candidatus Rokubacteria bacterium]|nr:hypothetical protein [Candidatus Rokubacteria bacterium]
FGHILRVVAESGAIDWFVVHVSIQNLFSYLADPETALESSIAGFLDVAHEFRERARWGLVLRTNGDPALDPVRAAYRARAAARGIPSFTRLEEAANAIAAFVSWAEHRERVEGGA